uniref:Sodium/calcium exchanger membrane region domain-containing protein n=1 Tax=Haptolina brevifila TaxID=156173 RepID=A0A7S2I4I4_9EUKA
MTVVWLDRIATELIALIETFGHLFNVSTSILGLTVIAIGNSIGDFVADTAAAREGSVSGARMAIAACFGSPVIMNIVSVGVSFTLRLLLTGGVPICFSPISTLTRLGFLLFYLTLLSHLIVFPLGGCAWVQIESERP